MRVLICVVALSSVALALTACREEGAMEKAGRKVDETIERLQHGDEGALEKAGRQFDEAIEESKKKK